MKLGNARGPEIPGKNDHWDHPCYTRESLSTNLSLETDNNVGKICVESNSLASVMILHWKTTSPKGGRY